MPVASARTRQLPPLGTARLAVATAHAIFSGDGRTQLAFARIGWLIASASRRARPNGNVHTPARIAAIAVSDWNRSARSDAGNAKNLAMFFIRAPIIRRRLVQDLYQAMRMEFAKQLQQIAAASLGFDVELIDQCVANLDHSAQLHNQAPNRGANRIESEVGPALEIQNGGLTVEIAGNLVLGCDHDGSRRDCLSHELQNVRAAQAMRRLL